MIDAKIIEDAIYNLCVEANTILPQAVERKIFDAFEIENNPDAKEVLGLILENAQIARENKTPLCQDTGQVIVFAKGQGKFFIDGFNKAINNGVKKAYEENFFRKSVVKDALFERINTKTNAPCVIYTEISDTDGLEIEIMIKGGGTENVSDAKMLSPTASEEEIVEFVRGCVQEAGAKACPPYFIGVGIGGTFEHAALLSKKSLLLDENIDENHEKLAKKIQDAINELNIGPAGLGGPHTALGVNILTTFTHIACMPVAVTINCHSLRHAKVLLGREQDIKSEEKARGQEGKCKEEQNAKCKMQNVIVSESEATPKENFSALQPFSFLTNSLAFSGYTKLNTTDVDGLKKLKVNQKILLSGTIYTARDMAHKRLVEMIEKGEQLPFELKDSIIFYAGPCPCQEPCATGAIGPTTASRMDKFASVLYQNGVLGTIGKGERSDEIKKTIKEANGLYLTAVGGIASYLSRKFIKKELVCFEDLGTEAVYRFEVRDLPLRVALG